MPNHSGSKVNFGGLLSTGAGKSIIYRKKGFLWDAKGDRLDNHFIPPSSPSSGDICPRLGTSSHWLQDEIVWPKRTPVEVMPPSPVRFAVVGELVVPVKNRRSNPT